LVGDYEDEHNARRALPVGVIFGRLRTETAEQVARLVRPMTGVNAVPTVFHLRAKDSHDRVLPAGCTCARERLGPVFLSWHRAKPYPSGTHVNVVAAFLPFP
jgi:hypothetical protein